jgi:hypothetical protein
MFGSLVLFWWWLLESLYSLVFHRIARHGDAFAEVREQIHDVLLTPIASAASEALRAKSGAS